MVIRVRLTGVTNGGSCVVEVVDNPVYRVDLPNDHWRITSGSLPRVTARRGDWSRFATLLNMHGLARLESFRNPVRVGNTGPGLSHGGGVVEWEVVP